MELSAHAVIAHTGQAAHARWLDGLCNEALTLEAKTWPKPGLVTPRDSGSHQDMDIRTLLASARALRGHFAALALAGFQGGDFATLQALGRGAERHMLVATGGVNTHRGAIFNLGLLVAAAALRSGRAALYRFSCGEVVARLWGEAILAARSDAPASHGDSVRLRHGAGGARAEAASGFPAVYDVGLPSLRQLLAQEHDEETARAGCLMSLMEQVVDTNLLWRGGQEGLDFVRRCAATFNRDGGVNQKDWRNKLMALHGDFVASNLSPGGSADLMAASWLAHRLEK